MNMRIFCVAVGLMTASTWAQVPVFKLWVTEVYEVHEPDVDGLRYTPKCLSCPTQRLGPGIALHGDLISIEVTVEGWDASTDSGTCAGPLGDPCSVTAQDCGESHCTGQTSGKCTEDDDCFPPGTCKPDSCDKGPLVGAFQWTIDCSTYSNGGAGPGLAAAQLPCAIDADCACAYTQVLPAFPDALNDCADYATCCGFCTCVQATCDDNTCSQQAAAFIDSSVIPGYLFFGHSDFRAIDFSSCNYGFGAFSQASPSGVPEELFRCSGGNQAICNVDADCLLGTCELTRTSPYYLGTLLLETTGESCGMFTLDLVQNIVQSVPVTTYLNDSTAAKLPVPFVETLSIDLGPSAPCPPGDPCLENCKSCAGGPCVCTPIECPPDETCVEGVCVGVGCSFDDLTDANWADADPLAAVRFDRPGDCAIDARQPHSINDENAKVGWDRLVLKFSCDPTDFAAGLRPANFAVETDPVEVSAPFIPLGGLSVDATDQTITIHLDRSISPGFYTCITHLDSVRHWCAGYLPADAGQNGRSSGADINELIDSINLVVPLPVYATDINRSTVTNGQDILRLIDLLNGAGDFNTWIAQNLPDCPSAP